MTVKRKKRPARNRRRDSGQPVPTPRPFVGVAASVALAIGVVLICWFGWQALTASTRLAIRQVEFSGIDRSTEEQLRAYTGPLENEPILEVDLGLLSRSLTRHPWVRSAVVRRQLPDRLYVEVQEHRPEVLVSMGDVYVADSQGDLFKLARANDRLLLPLITGLSRQDSTARPEEATRIIMEGAALADALSGSRLGDLEEIHWDYDLGWSIVTTSGSGGLVTHLGFDAVARIETGERLLARLVEAGVRPGVLWVDGPGHTRAQARPQAVAMATVFSTTLIAKAGD